MRLAILFLLSVAVIALILTIGSQRHAIDELTATLNGVLAADSRLKDADDQLQKQCDALEQLLADTRVPP